MNISVSPRFGELYIRIQRNISVGKKNVTDSITSMTAVALMSTFAWHLSTIEPQNIQS